MSSTRRTKHESFISFLDDGAESFTSGSSSCPDKRILEQCFCVADAHPFACLENLFIWIFIIVCTGSNVSEIENKSLCFSNIDEAGRTSSASVFEIKLNVFLDTLFQKISF